jgi:hypothetical protein
VSRGIKTDHHRALLLPLYRCLSQATPIAHRVKLTFLFLALFTVLDRIFGSLTQRGFLILI